MNQDIRAPYYGELGRLSFSPGWARPEPAMWASPKPKFKPAVWRFAAAKSALDQAGEFVLVVQAKPGTYTVVDGARVDMAPGHVVLTPSWCWHGHANESDATSYWIDFLDVPFVQHSEAMFFEPNPAGFEKIIRNGPSPFRIPARAALGPGNDAKEVEIAKGVLPTIGLHLWRLPSGTRRELPKSTVNNLYSVISGKARVTIEGGINESLAV